MTVKTSDVMARALVEAGVDLVLGISGAGNVHLFDSVAREPGLRYVCPHHEQAGVMAALAYQRVSSRLAVMITTSGAGATNAITGVVDAWADSIPCLVISGQESSIHARRNNPLRMWGVQGLDIARMVDGVTKYAVMVDDPEQAVYHLERALWEAVRGRPGPVWVDVPLDVQAAPVDPERVRRFRPDPEPAPDLGEVAAAAAASLAVAERPVVLIGQGVRLAGGSSLLDELVAELPVPFLTAWNGADLIAGNHPRHFGHAGNYGQRCANFVIQNCDLLLSVGSRLAIPQIGYVQADFARGARKIVVDVDPTELAKLAGMPDLEPVEADAARFLAALLAAVRGRPTAEPGPWLERCRGWRRDYPLVDPTIHRQAADTVNSYHFTAALAGHLAADDVVVTDMGTALTCTHQVLVLEPGQRLVTSTGLGEMGFGLPGAVGAALARPGQRVVLLVGDGAMMMNLQELQTIVHLGLPIKIFLYVNDGYLTIRHTEKALFGGRFTATGKDDGVSCPSFRRVAEAFGLTTFRLDRPEDTDEAIAATLAAAGPVLCEVAMDPMQPLVPKLSFQQRPDGSLVSPPIEDLFPFIARDRLEREMLVGVHPTSRSIDPGGDP